MIVAKERSFSPLKERIRQFAKRQNLSMREIYDRTGISVGTFSNSSSMSEDTLNKILACFEELDANWLLTGKGEMIRNISDSKDIGWDFDCWDFDDDHLFFTGK
jgi:hypothetical protein